MIYKLYVLTHYAHTCTGAASVCVFLEVFTLSSAPECNQRLAGTFQGTTGQGSACCCTLYSSGSTLMARREKHIFCQKQMTVSLGGAVGLFWFFKISAIICILEFISTNYYK